MTTFYIKKNGVYATASGVSVKKNGTYASGLVSIKEFGAYTTGGGPPPAWTPADLGSALVAWHDPSDAATITLGSGSQVASIADKSGNGRTLSQATAGTRPTVTAGGATWGSTDVLTFVASRLDAGTAWWVTNATNVFVLGAWPAATDIVGSGNISTSGDVLMMRFGTVFRSHFWTTPGARDGAVAMGTTPRLLHHQTQSAQMQMWQDGVLAAASIATAGSGTKTFLLGGRNTGSTMSGTVAEVVIVNGTLTAGQRQQVEGYLFWKRGLQSLLPAGHPYLAGAP